MREHPWSYRFNDIHDSAVAPHHQEEKQYSIFPSEEWELVLLSIRRYVRYDFHQSQTRQDNSQIERRTYIFMDWR